MAQAIVNLEIDAGESCPTCPHCGDNLSQLRMTVGGAQVTPLVKLIIYTYSCPVCGKILSVSGR